MGNKAKIQQPKESQYIVTIPKSLAEALGYRKGNEVEFVVDRGELVVRKVW